MVSVLKIKRSLNANAPGSLNTGELAVTFGAGHLIKYINKEIGILKIT